MRKRISLAVCLALTLCLLTAPGYTLAQRSQRVMIKKAVAVVQAAQDFAAWDAAYAVVGVDGDEYKAANADRVTKEGIVDDLQQQLSDAEAELAVSVAAEQAAYDELVASVDTLSTETDNIAPVQDPVPAQQK